MLPEGPPGGRSPVEIALPARHPVDVRLDGFFVGDGAGNRRLRGSWWTYLSGSATGQNACTVTAAEYRVIRGGYWDGLGDDEFRAACRRRNVPDGHAFGVGLRCARNP